MSFLGKSPCPPHFSENVEGILNDGIEKGPSLRKRPQNDDYEDFYEDLYEDDENGKKAMINSGFIGFRNELAKLMEIPQT